MSSSSASESRCSSSARRRGANSCSSRRSPSASVSAHSRSPARKSPTNRATASRPESANAVRNGRGSRLPKKLPACVMRKRGLVWCSSPAKSSKSQPFSIVTTSARGPSERVSSAIASEAATMASALRATSCATARLMRSLAFNAAESARRWGCASSESRRSATQRAPVSRCTAAPTKWTEPGGDVVSTASIPSRAHDASGRRDGRQHPADVLVRHEQPAPEQACLESQPVGARRAVQLLSRAATLRADVARAVDPRLRGKLQLVVAMHPLRVVRREHVRLDPQLGQMGRELQRPLHAAAARGREVERHDEHLHRR